MNLSSLSLAKLSLLWFIMANLHVLLLLILLLLPLIVSTATKKHSLLEFYQSLRQLPRLPDSPGALDRIRYECHKIYFQYLIIGPGYVLEPAERSILDAFIAVLLGAIVYCYIYCMVLLLPAVLRLAEGGILSGRGHRVVQPVNIGVLQRWSGI